mmetsp:Transcript_23250/g.49493  ORF Transcript_23250/g.49493 Transcript_23250/m.49493 type:complete len:211 (-) Transcript_23250:2639-3271(-)
MAMRVTPMAPPAKFSMMSRLRLSLLLSMMKSAPKKSWPIEWPKPQSPPRKPAAMEDRPMERGARAARWSGPVSECSAPAKRPAEALSISKTMAPRLIPHRASCSSGSAPVTHLPACASRWLGVTTKRAAAMARGHTTLRRADSTGPLLSGRRQRSELSATRSVEPSWTETESQRGILPATEGREAPRMDTMARAMFCFMMLRVLRATRKR